MNTLEAAELLVHMATFDGRTVEDGDAETWARVLRNMSLPTARGAVEAHYSTTHRRLMPSDLWTLVKSQAPEPLTDSHGACPFRGCTCTHTAPCDRGWIESSGSVRPCPNCRPEQGRVLADARGKPWGPDRLSDLRDRGVRRRDD